MIREGEKVYFTEEDKKNIHIKKYTTEELKAKEKQFPLSVITLSGTRRRRQPAQKAAVPGASTARAAIIKQADKSFLPSVTVTLLTKRKAQPVPKAD